MHPSGPDANNPQYRGILLLLTAAFPAIVIAGLSTVVFALPDQILDIYRDIAQYITLGPKDPTLPFMESNLQIWREPVFTIAAAICLAVVLWMTTKSFLATFRPMGALQSKTVRYTIMLLPTALAVLPLLA